MSRAADSPSAVQLRAALRATAEDLLRYFERRVSEREDAADVLSDTLLVAWRRVADLPPDDPERQRMWLFGIAARTLANHRRGRRRRSALVERLRSQLSAGPATHGDHAEASAVRDAVNRLKPDQRELVILVHWDGMTLSEAAELLGINPSTARSRYAAARAALALALGVSDLAKPSDAAVAER